MGKRNSTWILKRWIHKYAVCFYALTSDTEHNIETIIWSYCWSFSWSNDATLRDDLRNEQRCTDDRRVRKPTSCSQKWSRSNITAVPSFLPAPSFQSLAEAGGAECWRSRRRTRVLQLWLETVNPCQQETSWATFTTNKTDSMIRHWEDLEKIMFYWNVQLFQERPPGTSNFKEPIRSPRKRPSQVQHHQSVWFVNFNLQTPDGSTERSLDKHLLHSSPVTWVTVMLVSSHTILINSRYLQVSRLFLLLWQVSLMLMILITSCLHPGRPVPRGKRPADSASGVRGWVSLQRRRTEQDGHRQLLGGKVWKHTVKQRTTTSVVVVCFLDFSCFWCRDKLHLETLKAFVGLHEFSDLNLVQALRSVMLWLMVPQTTICRL